MTAFDQRLVTVFNVGSLTFGRGAALRCAEDLAAAGAASLFLVTTPPTRGLCAPMAARLEALGVRVTIWDGLAGEPTLAEFDAALAAARAARADMVVGLGGGSAMDVAKLVAALFDGAQAIGDVIGVDRLERRALPLACIPTTAGTGSEVTPIAILGDEDEDLKKGVVSRHLVPDAAYLDPELTVTMPRAVTAATGFDALTHCIEAYTSRFAHPIADGLALAGIGLIAGSIERACNQGDDLAAREAMLLASLYGGMCLGPVNTAAVHALAYPLGGEFHIAHGVANALLLPHVMRFNLEAAPERYAAVARAMGVTEAGDDRTVALLGVDRIVALAERCGIQRHMAAFGIGADAIPRMAAAAMTVTRLLERNPRTVTGADAVRIFEAAL
ncbi:iron-containing alcohol dehydrogenase [Sphingomonas canadensis]|uniref:Iron-containing alcohol dehydrogenase n=1 Tax=Sphingomonas canadensis TaxID=1219257 RepID=A0ABW3HE94_9SPHN|nr:iron-containing alcohol dehydrogenase [Sphingomonas canadensis]MCW3837693.1 iron-containing alcohol dehydrogenase [Sphingomonas canadensis]